MSPLPSAEPRCQSPSALGLDPCLEAAGFNTAGVLRARDYDELVPPAWRSHELLADARSAVVLGCGGRAFGDAFLSSPEGRNQTEPDPVDRFTARVLEDATGGASERITRALFYWQRRQGQFADFVALGRACGLGSPSRLGILLHPNFGPWFSIRALLLTRAAIAPTAAQDGVGACVGCSAPCAAACPGGALAGERFDIGVCSATTLSLEGCRQRCDARRACVIGRDHAYEPEMEQRFRSSVVRMLSRATG